MAEILMTSVVALALGIFSIIMLRYIIPYFYQQDRRLAQFIYLDLFWVALFFVVILYEGRSASSLGLTLGKDIVLTIEYILVCLLVAVLLFVVSAKRERSKGRLYIDKKKRALVIGNEGVDLNFASRQGFVQAFLMQVIWVALPLELFFRGYLVSRIAEGLNEMTGVIIAGIIYFIAYMDRPIFGNINLVFGLLWGFAYVQTGSILPGLVAHMFINTFSYYFARNIALSGPK